MKNKFKIFITMFLVFTLLLVGCSNTQNNETEEPKESNTTQKEVKEDNKEEDKVIKVGIDGVTPPWTFIEDNEPAGFEVELWKEIGKRIGYEVEFEKMDFTGLFGLLDSERIDTVANQVAITPERQEIYDFSDIYVYNQITFVSSADKKINDIKDLDGWSIACEPNSNDEDIIDAVEEEYGIKMKREFYDGASIKDVELGRLDLWIKAQSSAIEIVKEIGEDKLKILAVTPVIEENAYPFLKTDRGKKLMELTNGALKEMREDGTIKELSEKYFSIDVTQKPE